MIYKQNISWYESYGAYTVSFFSVNLREKTQIESQED